MYKFDRPARGQCNELVTAVLPTLHDITGKNICLSAFTCICIFNPQVDYGIGPPSAALLGRLCMRFTNMFMGNLDNSSRSALVRSDSDVGSNSSQRSSALRSGSLTLSSLSFRHLALCTSVQSGWNRMITQRFPTVLGTWNSPKCLGMLKHNSSHVYQTLATKPRLIRWTAGWTNVTCSSREHVSTALKSGGDMLYTTASNTSHCIWLCKTSVQLLSHDSQTHSIKLSIH